MPKCLHAKPRREKNPKGLPEAHRLWREHVDALNSYFEASKSVSDFNLVPMLPIGASTEEVMRHTQLLLKLADRQAQAQAKTPVASAGGDFWGSLFDSVLGGA